MSAPVGVATVPNLITLIRLLMVPSIVWLMTAGSYQAAFWLFVAAGVSDALDGFIAKQFDLRSRLGAYLDPLADKALLVSIYLTLGIQFHLPAWLPIMVISRDFLIVGGVFLAWVLDRPIEVRPLAVSKANTAAQILLAAFVLADLAFYMELDLLRQGLVIAVAALTVASATAYLVDWIRHMGRV